MEDAQPVSAGDQLTEGSKNPQDILRIQGKEEVQRYMVDEVQEVYRSQGVSINFKHIEIIVRQMLRRVQIEDPGETRFITGELWDEWEHGTPANWQPENGNGRASPPKPPTCEECRRKWGSDTPLTVDESAALHCPMCNWQPNRSEVLP